MTTTRPVLVTLEGTGTPLPHAPDILKVTYGINGQTGVVMIDTRRAGVTVETPAPMWQWSEGDVVAGSTIVYRRDDRGVWIGTGAASGHVYRLDDEMVSDAAGIPEGYDVLRYANGAA